VPVRLTTVGTPINLIVSDKHVEGTEDDKQVEGTEDDKQVEGPEEAGTMITMRLTMRLTMEATDLEPTEEGGTEITMEATEVSEVGPGQFYREKNRNQEGTSPTARMKY